MSSSPDYRLCAFVTVLVHALNVHSGLAVGKARLEHKVPLPSVTSKSIHFERVVRAHANNAEQYPQFLALMWVFAVVARYETISGLLGCVWVFLRFLYVAAYHKGENVGTYSVPCYMVLILYCAGIMGSIIKSLVEEYIM
jgi:uncharacterized MAPEG superfamily protein